MDHSTASIRMLGYGACVAEVGVGDVRINLGRVDGGVAE